MITRRSFIKVCLGVIAIPYVGVSEIVDARDFLLSGPPTGQHYSYTVNDDIFDEDKLIDILNRLIF